MTATYRIDYTRDGTDDVVVIRAQNRQDAMSRARYLSRNHGSAYAIRNDNGTDTGQQVYHNGYYSHTDDTF
jgi:hypothetical protein